MQKTLTSALLAAVATIAACGGGTITDTASPARTLPATSEPAGNVELGMASAPGEAATMQAVAPFAYRYQYLTGPADSGWAIWAPDGAFVTHYIDESAAVMMTPVFSYYVLLQSSPEGNSDEDRQARALNDETIMRTYFDTLRLFFERAGERPAQEVILHIEPDLWGFVQRVKGADPTAQHVQLPSGDPLFRGLPDSLTGFAQAIARLRDEFAPNVQLAFHASTWAPGRDFVYDDPPDASVVDWTTETVQFYKGLGVDFDFVFAEFSDRDAGFKQFEYGDGGASWFNEDDFRRHLLFVKTLHEGTGGPVILWQIPFGNTQMRAVDNTWNHYQDNRVEWLLDNPGQQHLRDYAGAGVVALLFGRGADGATDASDAAGDGIRDPEPINGNGRASLSADDDGGLFAELARRYYADGPVPIR
ncbi:MAG: hypothetical protein KC495_16680 [Dehalococcoidia bacterium]|nr:hypothetical protein [Dehalococcoidia bacterium]MCB9486026.1 hypothetical protein [Thermoflexaceae bacterium]